MQNELIQLGAGAHALAIQILGNREDAADAVQDALTKVLAAPESYDPGKGALKPWFFRIVRNRCLDVLRGRRPQSSAVGELPDQGPTPEEAVNRAQRSELIGRAINALSPEQRQIIVLRDYLDLSYSDIGVVLDVPGGTVMSRLHRARNALREELKTHVE